MPKNSKNYYLGPKRTFFLAVFNGIGYMHMRDTNNNKSLSFNEEDVMVLKKKLPKIQNYWAKMKEEKEEEEGPAEEAQQSKEQKTKKKKTSTKKTKLVAVTDSEDSMDVVSELD
jgi:hypothetical protein